MALSFVLRGRTTLRFCEKPTCDQVESLLKKTLLDRNFQLVVMNLPKNPLRNHHTKHVLLPERLKADSTIEWIGELIFTDWWKIDLYESLACHLINIFGHDEAFYTLNHIFITKYFCFRKNTQSMCLKESRLAHWKVLQKHPSIHILEQVWFKIESPHRCFPVVTWSLIQGWISHVPTKSLRDVRSRRISIVIVNICISLGCSGNTTRIMRRTLKIFLVSTVCVKQVSNWLVS